MTSLHLGGYDPLDVQLDDAAMAPPQQRGAGFLRRRFAGWSASSVPVASLLLVGIALGPRGISLLSPGVLSLLDPGIPVALAALGALVGLSVDLRSTKSRRAFTGAVFESGLTAGIVAGGILVLAPGVLTGTPVPFWLLAGALALCAATSLAVPGANPNEPRPSHLRIVELDVLAPLMFGGLLLGVLLTGGMVGALTLVSKAAVIAAILAASGWLLLARAASDTEQRVFAFATMMLIGGAADYLSLSALLSGLVAGALWQLLGGPAEASLRRDLLYVQHSLLVLVLVVAGAHADFSVASSAIAAVYVFLRTAGKLAGGAVAGRIAGASSARAFGFHLLPPGVFGVALALNIVRAAGPEATILLTIVVLGTIGSELVAEVGRPLELEPREVGVREALE
jgi:hypothetical protein